MPFLPDTYQALFRDYATSEWAKTMRTLIQCDGIAHAQHRTRDWLAGELAVSKHTLGKWIRCESFPRKEQIDHLKEATRSLEKQLETSDNARFTAKERSSCVA